MRATAPSSRRTIWHSSTFLSSSPSALLEHLQQQQATASPTPPSASVYALSKNIPAELLDSIHLALSTSTSHCPSIGVLSDVLPSHLALPNEQETFSIAFASYHPTSSTTKVVPFRSTLLGRPHISVGREVKQVDPSEEHHDVGFEAFLSGKKWGFGEGVNLSEGRRAVIDELKGVRCVTVDLAVKVKVADGSYIGPKTSNRSLSLPLIGYSLSSVHCRHLRRLRT